MRLPPMRDLRVRNFSGGLNLRDAVAEVAPDESPDLWNVTLDERGGVAKRLGHAKWNSSSFGAALVKNIHPSTTLAQKVTQTGATLTLGTTTTVRKTFSTAARVGFADFNGKVYAIHPIDGIYSSTDGITWTAVAGSPKGTFLVPWANRLIAGGDPSNLPRLYACKLADATVWTTGAGEGWTNDIREIDSTALIAAEAASGMDISGRAGLVVLKRDSAYRVYDASNGSYVTIDPRIGSNSALATESVNGRIYTLARSGIYSTDGIGAMVKESTKVDPLFRAEAIAGDQLDLCAVGACDGRLYFSFPRFGATANDIKLELHPTEGWITAGSDAASCYATDLHDTQELYGGSPTVNGQVYQHLTGGSDDGAAIASYFQTRWFEPSDGFLTRMLKLLPVGRGSFTLYVKTDYTVGQGTAYDVDISRGGFVWNAPGSTWNDPDVDWGPTVYEAYADPIPSPGVCRSVAFRVEETSSVLKAAPPLLGTGAARQIGAWALAGADLEFVQIGTA